MENPFKRKSESKSSSLNRQMLTDITRGLHHAASTTSALVAQQYIKMISQFFDSGFKLTKDIIDSLREKEIPANVIEKLEKLIGIEYGTQDEFKIALEEKLGRDTANKYNELLSSIAQKGGMLKAKMVRVEIDDNHYMNLPLVSLVAPKGIALERLKVEMSVRMDEASIKKATEEQVDNSGATRTSFKVSLSPKSKGEARRRSDIVDITMEFVAGDPPEGIMKLIDQYTNMIQPLEPEKSHYTNVNAIHLDSKRVHEDNPED